MRELVIQTAVMRRKATVTISRSMKGIMLISAFIALFLPPPSLPMSTPAIRSPTAVRCGAAGCGRGGARGTSPTRSRCLRSLSDGRDVHLLAVRDDQVQDLHGRLIDVVLDPLRLAVQHGVADE